MTPSKETSTEDCDTEDPTLSSAVANGDTIAIIGGVVAIVLIVVAAIVVTIVAIAAMVLRNRRLATKNTAEMLVLLVVMSVKVVVQITCWI